MLKKLSIFMFSFILVMNNAKSTHVVSADLTYECLGGLNYKFTLKLYRDCSGQSIGTFQAIDYSAPSITSSGTFLLFQDTSYEVSQVCDSLLPMTTCNLGTLPGIEVYIYSGNFTLPDSAADWNFENKICCRSTSITNLTSGFSFYTNTTLNNLDGKCNDSPTFQAIPLLYSCANETVNFNNIATDTEGDSLSFKLVRTWGDNNLNIPYTSAVFNATNPFNSTSGIVFDSLTGQVTFTSNTLQQVILTVLITEYDSVGNIKGTQRRDIQFIFIICPPPAFNPYTTGVNYDTLNYTYTGCYNTPISFDVFSISFDTINPIVLNYFSNIPNATFTTRINKDTTFGTFSWIPGTRLGNYYFRLQTIAKTCPLKRQNIFNYTIHIDTVFSACKDTTLYLSTLGYYVIDSSYVLDFASSGNCPIQSVTLSKDTFDCSDLGVNPISITTVYQNGLVRTCSANVTLIDTISPVSGCVDTTVYLNSAGFVLIDSSFVHDFTIVSCGTTTIELSKYAFTCSEIGANTVSLIVTEVNGLKDTCYGIVTVVDTFLPTAICADTTVYLNSLGMVTIDSSYIDNGSYDNCVIIRKYLSKDSFNCNNIGVNVIAFYAQDFYGNVDSCQAIVTVLDTNPIQISCKDTTVYLSGGVFNLTVAHVDSGNSSACGNNSSILDKYIFTCLDTGANTVKLVVSNSAGDKDSCYSIVTVIDTSKVAFGCKDTVVYLNPSGFFIIDSSFTLDSLQNTTCNLLGILPSKDTFRCSDIGANFVTTKVYYQYGSNSDSCTSIVTVLDTNSPTAICQNISVYLASNGKYTIDSSYIDNGSNDNCGIYTIKLSKYNFDCGDVGTNTIQMTVTDVNGNVSYCSAIATVNDTIIPTVFCIDTTVYLNSLGIVIIDSSYVNNGSYDSCGIASISLDRTSFDCTQAGMNTVAVIVIDVNGNSDTCSSIVTVLDTISPVVNCKSTVQFLNGTQPIIIDGIMIDSGSYDNCGIARTAVSKSSFNCTDIGINYVTLTISDIFGNVDSCVASVTIVDTTNPVAICTDTIIYINSFGSFRIDSSYIDNGSFDNCKLDSVRLSKYSFDCNDIGQNNIKLFAYDHSGNIDSCNAIVTVIDTLNPVAICKDTVIFLGSAGNFVIDSSFINNGSSDNCGIGSINLNNTSFNCTDIGMNLVTMIVIDVNGNYDTCSANINVLDTLHPVARCKNITIYVDASGNVLIDSSYINNGSNDNCGIAKMSISQTSFNCSNVGANSVSLVVIDLSGNIDSCTAIVTVLDTINPVAICKDTTVYINSFGFFTIDPYFIENGSFDNCTLDSVRLSKYTFNCADVGIDTIQLYAYDNSGNIDSCSAIVNVIDTTNPIAICKDTTIYLDTAGTFAINSSFVNAALNFGCPLGSITLSKDTFNCSNIGTNNVTMSVTDVNGNVDSCTAVVTVLDTIKPIVICQNISAYLDSSGFVVIDSSMIDNGSYDNCGIWKMTIDQSSFNCTKIGSHTVTLTITDANGNIDSCTATVIILDTIKPNTNCQDTTIYLSTAGMFSIDSTYTNNGSNDNCGITTIKLSQYNFDCSDVGSTNVTMTVTDVNGNVDSCISVITVIDTVNPQVICKNNTVYLNSFGTVSIDSSMINNGSSDSCGISTITLSQDTFNCLNVGANFVTMIVTDVNGNSDSCTAVVTVVDTINPIVSCQNISIYLDQFGSVSIDSSSIDNGSNDNCGISTMAISQSNFDCTQLGMNSVALTVTDVNGNVDTCSSIVTVYDTLNPITICKDTSVYLDVFGNLIIDSIYIDNGSSDNCGISSITLSQYQFGCVNVGANPVTMIVTDVNGNIDSCMAIVTILDTFIPTAFAGIDTNICGYLTIQVNATPALSHQMGTWSYVTPSPSLPVISNLNNPQAIMSSLVKGTYEFIWSVTNGNGCNVTRDTVQVNILDTLFAFAGPDISLCDQYNTNLMGIPTPLGISGSWSSISGSPSVPIISNPISATSAVSNLREGIYPFIWTVSNGLCMDVYDTTLVEVYDMPVSNAGSDQNLCALYATTLSGNLPVGRSNGTWSILSSTSLSSPSILDSNVYNTSISGLQEGTYNIVWTVRNGNCPPVIDTMVINVYDIPNSNAGLDTILCDIDSVRLFATAPIGTSSGVWNILPNGSPITQVLSDSSWYNSNISNLTIGATQLLTWTISNGTCPDDMDTVEIKVQTRPIVNAGNDTSICANYSVNLNALPLVSPSTGYWYVDSSSAPNTPTILSKNNPSTSVTGLIEGTYKFIWRALNLPCFDITDTVEVSIFNQHVAFVGSDQFLCNKPQTIITGNSVLGSATTKWVIDSYRPNLPTFDSIQNSTSLGGLLQGGVYSMVWEIRNGVCPVSRDTIIVTNQFTPNALFTQNKDEICQGETITFLNRAPRTLPVAILSRNWEINGKSFTGSIINEQFDNPGYYDVSLVIAAANGCLDTIQKDSAVFVHTNPIADFSIDYIQNTLDIEVNNQAQFACCYLYDFGNGNTSTLQDPIYTFSDTGNRRVLQIVANPFGCLDSISKTVYVQFLTAYVPNAFTPNNDNINDVFMPVVSGNNPKNYEFTVYNRWGEMIFRTESSNEGWDGKFKGEKVPAGVYVWTLISASKIGGKILPQKGHVTLIR